MSSSPSPQSPLFGSAPSFESEGRRLLYYGVGACLVLLAFVSAWSRLRAQLFSSDYMPHIYCYLANRGLVWSHVITDSLIGISYLGISVTLAHLVYKGRREIPFRWMFLAFGLFVVACGFTHFMEVVTVWVPVYILSAAVKGFTAAASMTTAIVLPFVVPQILLTVRKARESEQYTRFLESAVSERDTAQRELTKLNEILEARIQERTAELARADEILRASEEQYRLLFDSNPMPMWVFDSATLQFLAVNKAAIRHYGYSQEEFLSMTIADIRPEEGVPGLMDSLSKGVAGLSEAELWSHRKRDGTVIQVEITSHPISLAGRDAELILSQDVTEQRKNQESLRHSEERFATAFRSSPLAITISTEKEGRYVDANDAFVRMMGYQREEIIGRTAHELRIWVEPDDRSQMVWQMTQTDPTDAVETRFRTKSGEERHVRISTERIILDGEPCVLANTLDVTEARRLEEQFRQAQKMEAVGRLAGGVAHDFNNLLSVIMGYSELAQDTTPPGAAVRKQLDQIKNAAERAAALTRQLLAFSRQQVLELKVLNLNGVVNNVSKMLLRLIGEDITLSLKPGEPLGSVKADLGQIEQVLMNLAVNARDAMPEGGKIAIQTSNVELDETYAKQHPSLRPGSYVMLSFSDTGCGMDAKTRSRLFEPFFTTKGPGKGTGLGLSTVYGIVKQSGGYIWTYSEPERGATFKIYLPRVDSPAQTLHTERLDLVFDRGTETILLVEDDNSLRALTAELLRGAGYTVLEAADGNAAIELANRQLSPIDLVLTDVIMPGMSGGELIVHLRHLRPKPKLAVLFMSGYAGDFISRAGVPESDGYVLHKPFTRRSLLTKVRSVLDEAATKS
jgi:two-component system cell cycle sensor histidine kinase/response regulator CckA